MFDSFALSASVRLCVRFCCQNGGDLAAAGESTIATGEKLKCTKRVAFQRVISNKGKRTLMAAEMGQVNAVLAADSFKQDPFLAIQARKTRRES